MIEDFIDSALIIDDIEDEIIELGKSLEDKDIWVKYYTPEKLKSRKTPLKNRKIIFLDLYISKTATEIKGNISELRKILQKSIGSDFGSYGVILWTNHITHIDIFKQKIQGDANKYTLPLFVVGLDKRKYLESGYDQLFDDIQHELSNNIAASFFVRWSILVRKGRDNAITNIYSLIKDYKHQDKNLQYILFQLAKNYTGIPEDEIEKYRLDIDAIKAFNDMMTYEITSDKKIECDIFKNIKEINFVGETEEKENIYANINTKILIDTDNIDQGTIIPGNIYKVVDSKGSSNNDNKPVRSSSILVEMTPPCDFAYKRMKNQSRVLYGFMSDYSKKEFGKYNKDFYYHYIYPINIKGENNSQMIIFDFRTFGLIEKAELEDENKYKILFRVKDNLFADILQKLASHIARLGLPIIN